MPNFTAASFSWETFWGVAILLWGIAMLWADLQQRLRERDRDRQPGEDHDGLRRVYVRSRPSSPQQWD
jgi:hypothetical protein